MDESPKPHPQPHDGPSSVMDVVPPRPVTAPEETTPPAPAEKHHPKHHHGHDEPPKPEKPATPPKQPGSGVGLAIFATIVIVLGLAALAVYAYLKSNGNI